MNYLVAIPAHNAAETIGGVLQQLSPIRQRVVVVDDGSVDMTMRVAESFGFTVLRHKQNKGVGAALKTAIAHALSIGYTHLVTLDADGQHPPDRIAAFQAKLVDRDFVIGNRFCLDLELVHDSKLAANLAAALTVNSAFGVRLADVTCGYRAFRCADWMLELPSDGYGFLYEQLVNYLLRSDQISTVEVSPVFIPCNLWATRTSEIRGFLSAMLGHPSISPLLEQQLTEAISSVHRRRDFVYDVNGHIFHCLYMRSADRYFIQTDVKKARRTMQDLTRSES
jgi:glycosyltransferase involved in cell wall biosynthesis